MPVLIYHYKGLSSYGTVECPTLPLYLGSTVRDLSVNYSGDTDVLIVCSRTLGVTLILHLRMCQILGRFVPTNFPYRALSSHLMATKKV
jgi:hypothetical protein